MFSPTGELGDIPAERVHDAVSGGGVIGVPVISPDGTHVMIPSSRLHDALKAGGTIDSSGWTPEQEKAEHPGLLGRAAATITGPGTIGEDIANRWAKPTPIAPITPASAHEELSKAIIQPANLMTPGEQQRNPEISNVLHMAGSFSSPENLAIMIGSGGLGAMPGPAGKLIGKALTAGFTIQQIQGAIQEAPKFLDAISSGDELAARDALSKFVLAGAVAVPGAAHIAGKEIPFATEGEKASGQAVGAAAKEYVGEPVNWLPASLLNRSRLCLNLLKRDFVVPPVVLPG